MIFNRIILLGVAAFGALAAANLASRAEDNPAALAKALPQASVSLEKGLAVSEREGKPISGKFELEGGALQLSVYTAKGGGFKEVIIDHKSGAISKAETISGEEDLKDAKEQNDAMAKAKSPLSAAVARAVQSSSGYRAVSVVPAMEGGHSTAVVTLMKGNDVKKVTQKLD